MKKVLSILLACVFVGGLFADETTVNPAVEALVRDINIRYQIALNDARNSCSDVSGQINQLRLSLGLSVGAGAVGTVAGGAALTAGLVRSHMHRQIAELQLSRQERLDYLINRSSDVEFYEAARNGELLSLLKVLLGASESQQDEEIVRMDSEIAELERRADTLGVVRTAGAFTAGAGGVVGTVGSAFSIRNIDDLIDSMNQCTASVGQIEQIMRESGLLPAGIVDVSHMNRIVSACSGFDVNSVTRLRGRIVASTIAAGVGAAAGVAGGVASVVAQQNEIGHNANTVANVAAGVAAAGNLGGAILSGTTLAEINRNTDIAARCINSF